MRLFRILTIHPTTWTSSVHNNITTLTPYCKKLVTLTCFTEPITPPPQKPPGLSRGTQLKHYGLGESTTDIKINGFRINTKFPTKCRCSFVLNRMLNRIWFNLQTVSKMTMLLREISLKNCAWFYVLLYYYKLVYFIFLHVFPYAKGKWTLRSPLWDGARWAVNIGTLASDKGVPIQLPHNRVTQSILTLPKWSVSIKLSMPSY